MIGKATKRLTALISLFSIIFSLTLPAAAVEPLPDTSEAKSVYLWNAEYDKAIISKSEGTIFPASTVKIMTGLVAIDLISTRLDEKVTISAEMLLGNQGTRLPLTEGEVVSFRDLLYAAICGGFNDAANALATASAGSKSQFVAKMNEKAKELGAKDTNYTNPTGWHDEGMVTTLHDTALICKAAMKNELYVTVSSASSYIVPKNNKSDKFTVHNRNGLIGSHYTYGYRNQKAKGLIAGMTDEGGHCVATFFESDGLTYLCVVMGATESENEINSYKIANSLISYVSYYYGTVDAIKSGQVITSVPVGLAVSTTEDYYMLDCTAPSKVSVLAPYDRASLENIELVPYFFSEEITAPIKKGDVIGGVDIFIDGVLSGNADLCASEDVSANTVLATMEGAKNLLVSRAFIIFFIVFSILFALYFFFFELHDLRKKDKKIRFDRIY